MGFEAGTFGPVNYLVKAFNSQPKSQVRLPHEVMCFVYPSTPRETSPCQRGLGGTLHQFESTQEVTKYGTLEASLALSSRREDVWSLISSSCLFRMESFSAFSFLYASNWSLNSRSTASASPCGCLATEEVPAESVSVETPCDLRTWEGGGREGGRVGGGGGGGGGGEGTREGEEGDEGGREGAG